MVCPVHDRDAPRIVHELTPDFDTVAGRDPAARSDADVVDDLEFSGAALHVERLVHAMRS